MVNHVICAQPLQEERLQWLGAHSRIDNSATPQALSCWKSEGVMEQHTNKWIV